MRKRLWQLHSWLGLTAGLGLLIIGLTGSLLVFAPEVDRLVGQGLPEVVPQPTRASLDEVIAAVLARHPGLEIFSWYGSDARDRPERISGSLPGSGERLDVPFDPYTGKILESSANQSAFSGWLLSLHTSLLLRTPGVFLAGLLAAALVLSGLSGVFLYREFWRHFFTLRWRRSARILLSDGHRFVGITSVGFNLILGFSGALWNLPAASDLFAYRADESAPPARVLPPQPLTFEAMKAAAQTQLPGFIPRALRYPGGGDDFYNVRGGIPTWNIFASGWGDEVHFDPATGAVTGRLDLRQESAWTRFEDILTPLHFGTFGGLPIKILWCLGGLTPGLLGVSGFLIWRARAKGRRHRPQSG